MTWTLRGESHRPASPSRLPDLRPLRLAGGQDRLSPETVPTVPGLCQGGVSEGPRGEAGLSRYIDRGTQKCVAVFLNPGSLHRLIVVEKNGPTDNDPCSPDNEREGF